MELRPIFSALRHHMLTAALLMMQVAFTYAIACNVASMVSNRVAAITTTTGITENELVVVQSDSTDDQRNAQAMHRVDLAALRAIPGVESAAAVSYSIPLNNNETYGPVCLSRKVSFHSSSCAMSSFYDGTPGLIKTVGLQLIAGRDFDPDEYTTKDNPPAAIISRELANRLYPSQDALGKTVYMGSGSARVVGIVATLLRPKLHGAGENGLSLILSQLPDSNSELYLLRSASADRERVLKAAVKALYKNDPIRIIDPDQARSYTQVRSSYFKRDATMIGLLVASAVGLLFVTVLGIAGLANFWVQQRRRSIGIRRAIGATRGDILRYFQCENFLIVATGISVGVVLAIVLNRQLMKFYELPRLPLWCLVIGALTLGILGQVAAFFPARRASRVPPVEAMRS